MLSFSSAVLSALVKQSNPDNMPALLSSINYFSTSLLDYLEFKRDDSKFECEASQFMMDDGWNEPLPAESAVTSMAYHNGRFDAFNEILDMLSELRHLNGK